ncbi:DNA cytosine methyltransferase [Kocuria marina]
MFSGYGGLDQAVHEVFDAETAWVAEFEAAPSKVLARRFSGVPNLGDVTAVDWAAVDPVDIIAGGFPCQDISPAGRRGGLHSGTRSSLYAEIIKAATILQPEWIVLENVRALLSGKDIVDEPNDRCLCGWPYRWGGLHPHPEKQGPYLPPSGHHRDDAEGIGNAPQDATRLRWEHQDDATIDREMGCRIRVDCGRPGGKGSTGSSAAVPRAEGGASPSGVEASGSARLAATQVPQLTCPSLDSGGAGTWGADQAADARTQREGTQFAPHAEANPGGEAVCPGCGRPSGGTSSRPVQRSWMGAVCRDLSRIGYDAEWRVVRASDVGAPHQRARVFVLAHATGVGG